MEKSEEIYKTILKDTIGEIVEKKSKFICEIRHIENEEDFKIFLSEVKKKHFDARHNCYAYVLKDDNIERFSDDGEPQGSSGLPMLSVLKGEGLKNVAAITTRYFGGTLLGVGGLVRAYKDSVKEAIKNAIINSFDYGYKIRIDLSYEMHSSVVYYLEQNSVIICESEFLESIRLTIDVIKENKEKILEGLTSLTKGKIKVISIEECMIEIL